MEPKIFDNVVDGGPALEIPGHLSLGQHVIDTLRKYSANEDRVALINGETGHKMTHKELLQQIVNSATGLKHLGVKRGDVVAVLSENRDEYYGAVIGAVCCGATVTTVSTFYTKDEVTHALGISRPSLIFCSEATLEKNYDLLNLTAFVKHIIQLNGNKPAGDNVMLYTSMCVEVDPWGYVPEDVCGATDTALILYSSGTSGLPKGVMLSHVNAIYATVSLNCGYTRDECLTSLSVMPWYHTYGLLSTLAYLYMHKIVVYLAKFAPEKYLKCISEYKVHVLLIAPPLVLFLGKSPLVDQYDMSSVKVIWCAAAPLTPETVDLALKRLPNSTGLYQAYGMTEATLAICKELDIPSVRREPGSSGYPIPGLKMKVLDSETGLKVGANHQGEICVKGPLLMQGYINNEAASRATLDSEGYLRTGDNGYYDKSGNFYIVDRLKDLIKYKAYQVAPAALESVLLQHSSVADCGVVGAPDEEAGELPTAFVVIKPGAQLTEQELLDFTNERVSLTARLRGGVHFVDEIPKNGAGKILRRLLKLKLVNR